MTIGAGVLSGVKVLDVAHAYSAALSASLLADLGAEVVCIEHPSGSQVRQTLPKSKGQALWWKNMARGKRCITLNLSSEEGRRLFLQMVPHFDVMVENFRPGTLERWQIGPADIDAAGGNLSLLRISGYGQTGPRKNSPGFGTIAEAFSGFAHLNGFPDGPPVFPSMALADGVAATFGAFGLMASLVNRLRTGRKGVDVIDVALFEALFRLSPVQVMAYDQLGQNLKRPGNLLSTLGLIRNLYTTSDDVDFVVSTVGERTISRLITATDVPAHLTEQLASGILSKSDADVTEFILACDRHIASWAKTKNWAEVERALTAADATFERIYSTADIFNDEHYRFRENLVTVQDDRLGEVTMSGVVPKFPDFHHGISHAGPVLGEHNLPVYKEYFGFSEEEVAALQKRGVA
jgi:crotonobetainyl-CoA:carnitine CoA-transferase CaiB-like acyl-CoA transferase